MLERHVWLVGWPPIINPTQLYVNRSLSTYFYWLYHHYRRRYRAHVISPLYERSSLYTVGTGSLGRVLLGRVVLPWDGLF
jgi:hypothetical protein